MLFNQYYKGFELLWWYLVKHPVGVDLGSLDLEEVDEEMETNEASQSAFVAPEGNALEPILAGGDEATT